MREMIISELTQAVHDLARGFAHYLPRLIVMLDYRIRGMADRIRGQSDSCAAFSASSSSTACRKMPALLNCSAKQRCPSATEVLSRFVFWVTWLGFHSAGCERAREFWACRSRSQDFFCFCRACLWRC